MFERKLPFLFLLLFWTGKIGQSAIVSSSCAEIAVRGRFEKNEAGAIGTQRSH